MPLTEEEKRRREEERRRRSAIPEGQEGRVFGKTIVPQREFRELERRGKVEPSPLPPTPKEVRIEQIAGAKKLLGERETAKEIEPQEQREDVGEGFTKVTRPDGTSVLITPEGRELPIFQMGGRPAEISEQVLGGVGRVGQIAAGGIVAGAGIGLVAGGLTASTGAVATAAAKTTIATGISAKTTGIAALASKLGGSLVAGALGVFGVSKIIGIPTSRLQSIDTALGQIRETITAPVAGVRNGAITPAEGLDALDDLENSIDIYENSLQELSIAIRATTLNREKLDSAQIRIRKLRAFIEVAKQDIAIAAVGGQLPDPEQLAIMLNDFKR